MNDESLSRLADIVFEAVDSNDRNGAITCSEFVNSCTENDAVKIRDLVKFLEPGRKRGLVEMMLDDTHEQTKRHANHLFQHRNVSLAYQQGQGPGLVFDAKTDAKNASSASSSSAKVSPYEQQNLSPDTPNSVHVPEDREFCTVVPHEAKK